MRAILRDLRYAARSLRKSRALAAVAIVALTFGIGLTTTMFSIVYAVLIRGLPFDEPDRIVMIQRHNLSRNVQRMSTPIHDFIEYRAQQRSLERIAAHYGGTVNISGTERAERVSGAWVSAELFDVLRVRPLLGRTFTRDEETPGAGRVAVLSYQLWRDRYGRDPRVIGTAIRANGVPHTVIGVMPEGFAFPEQQGIWMPLQHDVARLGRGEGQWLEIVARLGPGVTVDAANADLAAIARRIATEYKATNEGVGAAVRPFIESQIGPQPRRLLWTMLGAVFMVLLVACANVANLLLDRAAHRTKEVGIRTALGASRGAVVRQFLGEALVLAAAGALLGVGVAQAGITLFNRAIVDTQPPFWLDISLHPPVLLFIVGVAVVASLASGAIPAYQSSRADINAILKDESRGASSFRIGRLSRGLVVVEIALSCGLLVASALMIKSVVKLGTMDPGFTTANILTARLGFPATYTDTAAQRRFYDELATRLVSLPGVEAATLSSQLPGVGSGNGQFAVEGVSYARDQDHPDTRTLAVAPGFFDTFGVRVVEGRALGPQDRLESLPVVVVNEAFAKRYVPGGSPLGRRIRFGDSRSTQPWRTIVGVVPDMYSGDAERPTLEMAYTPLAQTHTNFVSVAARARADAMALTSQVRAAVAAVDADIPIYWVYSMDQALARNVWHIRVFGTLFMVFGVVALFLAAVGLYAVMAFSVSRRTREVGIRMALGARAPHVVRLVLRQGLLQLAIGLTLGLGLAAAGSQLIAGILFDVQPRDPVVFAAVVATLTLAGLLACYVPARRAARVDPLNALRSE